MRLPLLPNVIKPKGIPLARRFRRLAIETLEGRALPAALVDMPIAGGVRDRQPAVNNDPCLPMIADSRLANRASRAPASRAADSGRTRNLKSVAVAQIFECDDFLDELKRIL